MTATPTWLPVRACMLSAEESAAVEKAVGCLGRALERLQEAQNGLSIYGRDVLLLARVSTHKALDALDQVNPAPDSPQSEVRT